MSVVQRVWKNSLIRKDGNKLAKSAYHADSVYRGSGEAMKYGIER